MTPIDSQSNGANCSDGHPKTSGKLAMRYVRARKDLNNVIDRQPMPRHLLASWLTVGVNLVRNVVVIVTPIEMARVYAWRVVALMKGVRLTRRRVTVGFDAHIPVRSDVLGFPSGPAKAHGSVPLFFDGVRPNDAFIGGALSGLIGKSTSSPGLSAYCVQPSMPALTLVMSAAIGEDCSRIAAAFNRAYSTVSHDASPKALWLGAG